MSDERSRRTIASNRKARRDFEILETFEAGLVLMGTEVKALRAGKATVGEAYISVTGGEAFIQGMYISPYEMGNRENHEPTRVRKLLLSRAQIDRIRGRVEQKGLTVVALELYFWGPYAKVSIALARGKRDVDRRQDIAQRDADREIRRNLRRADR